jgi:hypothetical protein
MSTVRFTREQIAQMHTQTDWKRLESISDEEIDLTDSDVPERGPSFWSSAHRPGKDAATPVDWEQFWRSREHNAKRDEYLDNHVFQMAKIA